MNDDAKIASGLKMVSNAARAAFVMLPDAINLPTTSCYDRLHAAEFPLPWLRDVLSDNPACAQTDLHVKQRLDIALAEKRATQPEMKISLSARDDVPSCAREYA